MICIAYVPLRPRAKVGTPASEVARRSQRPYKAVSMPAASRPAHKQLECVCPAPSATRCGTQSKILPGVRFFFPAFARLTRLPTCDPTTVLPIIPPHPAAVNRICSAILSQLDDQSNDVQSIAVKWYAWLVLCVLYVDAWVVHVGASTVVEYGSRATSGKQAYATRGRKKRAH